MWTKAPGGPCDAARNRGAGRFDGRGRDDRDRSAYGGGPDRPAHLRAFPRVELLRQHRGRRLRRRVSARSGRRPAHGTACATDVLKLCRELGLPVVRWPGGNFTSPYRWEDGIGPREERPRRLELAWGGEESNRFGTDEFLTWCAEVGDGRLPRAQRSGCRGRRALGGIHQLRRRHRLHPPPCRERTPGALRVRYWGLGNEAYGPWQFGHRSAQAYASAAREHGRFMRKVDPSIKLVGVGIPWQQEEWTRPVLEQTANLVDYLSLHLYAASTHLYTGDNDFEAVVAQPLYFEQQIARLRRTWWPRSRGVRDRNGRSGLALDEWNIRHLEPTDMARTAGRPRTEESFLARSARTHPRRTRCASTGGVPEPSPTRCSTPVSSTLSTGRAASPSR